MDEEPRDSVYWDSFENFCQETGISLEHTDDWHPWWECFMTGVEAAEDGTNDRPGGEE